MNWPCSLADTRGRQFFRAVQRAVALSLFCIALVRSVEESDRIIGGNPAEPNKYQEFVSLTTGDTQAPNIPFCGGTLIRKDVVLTAAHCVIKYDKNQAPISPPEINPSWQKWRVFKGNLGYNSANTQSGEKEMKGADSSKVKKIVFNPGYDVKSAEGDIALVFLEEKLPGPFAKLPKTEFASDPPTGDPITVIGFGANNNYFVGPFNNQDILNAINAAKQQVGQPNITQYAQAATPPVLYEVTLSAGDPSSDACKVEGIPEKGILCLVGEPFDLNEAALNLNDDLNAGLQAQLNFTFLTSHCFGDSGGPAYDKNGRQVGINSFVINGNGKCSITFDAISNNYTKVREYLRWIRSTILSERVSLLG